MNELDILLSVAFAEEGYLEKQSNKNLNDKTANPGNKNFTKYASDFDNKYPDFYNGKKNGFAWCDVFVDWCFVTAFGVDRALELLCQPKKSCGAGVGYSANYYKNKGQFYTSNPQAGDQIFFKDSSGRGTHTGLVYQVDKTYVYTIEGNTSSAAGVVDNGGCVRKKKYTLNYKYIYGYGRPKYRIEKKKAEFSGKYPVLPSRGYFKVGDTGSNVKILQELLNYVNNANLVIDGNLGSKTQEQIKVYQKNVGAVVDGLFGKQTLSKAIEQLSEFKIGTYTVIKAKYVRKQPKVDNNKIKYSSLDAATKKLCIKDSSGNAKFKVDSKVTITLFGVDGKNNIWGMHNNKNYWLCVKDSTGKQVK